MNTPTESTHESVSLERKLSNLRQWLARQDGVAVAFSGGVDSTFLLSVALEVLGGRAVAMLASTPFVPGEETRQALEVARRMGCEPLVVEFDPLAISKCVENPANRCYYCKHALYSRLRQLVAAQKIDCLVDGTNVDDLQYTRPGLKALRELDIETPLVKVELSKKEIRLLSRQRGLPTWDHLSASCLATRIPTGTAINQALLNEVEDYESFLATLGFAGHRARLLGENVCLELTREDHEQFGHETMYREVEKYFMDKGKRKVFLDLSVRPGILT